MFGAKGLVVFLLLAAIAAVAEAGAVPVSSLRQEAPGQVPVAAAEPDGIVGLLRRAGMIQPQRRTFTNLQADKICPRPRSRQTEEGGDDTAEGGDELFFHGTNALSLYNSGAYSHFRLEAQHQAQAEGSVILAGEAAMGAKHYGGNGVYHVSTYPVFDHEGRHGGLDESAEAGGLARYASSAKYAKAAARHDVPAAGDVERMCRELAKEVTGDENGTVDDTSYDFQQSQAGVGPGSAVRDSAIKVKHTLAFVKSLTPDQLALANRLKHTPVVLFGTPCPGGENTAPFGALAQDHERLLSGLDLRYVVVLPGTHPDQLTAGDVRKVMESLPGWDVAQPVVLGEDEAKQMIVETTARGLEEHGESLKRGMEDEEMMRVMQRHYQVANAGPVPLQNFALGDADTGADDDFFLE